MKSSNSSTNGAAMPSKAVLQRDRNKLLEWFGEDQRELPWRQNKDPYKIWLSEVMLQQTTVKAVIPYFQQFVERFPTVESLARAQLDDVYELWTGLGYYSRARSLYKAAKILAEQKEFPRSYREWLHLPGVGDYTSRAIASIAFGEAVGVVDGNVVRVLSRRWDQPWEWWKTKDKKEIQQIADDYATGRNSGTVNQALMELGSTICTPKSPSCILCPWSRSCQAHRRQTIEERPLARPRRRQEIWHWEAQLVTKKDKVALVENKYAPFLKGEWILPGTAHQKSRAPRNWDFKHAITHHNIFATVARKKSNFLRNHSEEILWLSPKQLKQKVPFSLIQKAIAVGLDDRR